MSLWPWVIGTGAGLAGGYTLGRRGGLRREGRRLGGTILPSPSVRWLRESYGALGVWTLGRGESTLPEAALDSGLAAAEAELVESRLKQSTVGVVGAVERLERGVLIVERLGDRLAAMLLPPINGSAGVAGEKLDRVRSDLQALLEAMAYRGVAEELTSGGSATVDTPGTLALGLAFELEQQLGVETLVAVLDGGVVRILGISGRADRRLLGVHLPADSPLAQVARGEVPVIRTPLDPTGSAVPDRRHRAGHAEVFVLRGDRDIPIGAVSMALLGDGRLAPPAQQIAQQTLKMAGPKLWASIRLERERSVARTDALTGLLNRRGIEEMMGKVGLPGTGTGGALVACDLDRFKTLNDTLGHAAGDAALVHFAAILKELVRGSDTAARVGGEEFHVWAPGATLERGAEIGERIRARLADSQFNWQGTAWPITASFGVASVPGTSSTVHNLPVQADAALYVAKQRGRNRVEVAPGG
jgi:diguanylate cyclase (GGDEF)-like protein